MHKTRFSLSLLALMGLSSGALASHAKLDSQEAMTQIAMNQCAAEAYKSEDALLNQNYKALRAKLNSKEKHELKQVQLTWLKYRDQQCAFESARYEGGSIYPLIMSRCLHGLTKQRIAVLGDMRSQPR